MMMIIQYCNMSSIMSDLSLGLKSKVLEAEALYLQHFLNYRFYINVHCNMHLKPKNLGMLFLA